jgi:hypothetical protein
VPSLNQANADLRVIYASISGKSGKGLHNLLLLIILISLIPDQAVGQLTLRGMVVDSATMQPLPYVNIVVKTTGPGTVSDLRGSFELNAEAQDTIVFSRVGYHTKMLPAFSVAQLVLVFLKEERRMLDEIEIKHKQPAWLPDPAPVSAWNNPTFNKDFVETPGFQGIQTFGPGYVFRMPGSGFRKEARAKQRLNEVREENDKATDYIHLVNGPEIKDKMMKEYALSEEKYYELLAKFNERNGDFIYKLETFEVIPLLLQFFADEAGKLKK